MPGVYPSPSRLRRVIVTVETLLDLFDGKHQPPPQLASVTIAEPHLGALPDVFRDRLDGNRFYWCSGNTETWVRRSECLRALEADLNPGRHKFGSPERRGRLVRESVGWNDVTGCPQAFRDLFEVHDELVRAHGLELMPETGLLRAPAYPILDHLGLPKPPGVVGPQAGEQTSPLTPFDATSLPPLIPFWVREQLPAVLGRLRQVLERGSTSEDDTGDERPEPCAPHPGAVSPPALDGDELGAGQNGVATSKSRRQKKSTVRGEGREKLIAALTEHHRYADGGCLNQDPIGNNELAEKAEVSVSTASAFFKKEFEGYKCYLLVCRDSGRLVASLKLLNGEFSPHSLYGRRPAGEDDRDEE